MWIQGCQEWRWGDSLESWLQEVEVEIEGRCVCGEKNHVKEKESSVILVHCLNIVGEANGHVKAEFVCGFE